MITLDIVTPTRKLVDGVQTEAIRLPTAVGEITILPGHTELLTLLATGVLSFSQGGRERKFAMSYGFAEIRQDKILVLAETCEESQDIDRGRAQTAQKKAETTLSSVLTESQFKKHQLKLQRAIVRQSVAP